MNWNSANFEAAFGTLEQIFPSDIPEICFSGRSNVGKSSLINKILNRKSIARVSSTPGKTVTINFYKLDGLRLVDLPGYGYAKVNDSEKQRWASLMEGYFRSGRNIKLVFQLIDMRRGATEYDISMIEFMRYMKIPFAIVLTKCDKLNKGEFNNSLKDIKEQLKEIIEQSPVLPFSALKNIGVEDIRQTIIKSIEK